MTDNRMCMHYTLERLGDIKTQTDLDEFKDEIIHNLNVNDDFYSEDFDVYGAIDRVKRDYIERALDRSGNIGDATNLLGIKNYQTLQNWMAKLEIDRW